VAEDKADNEPTLVERWLGDQQQWQRTVLAYLDSMVKSDEFLVHLGNAMRGSLLAGKPFPTAAGPGVSAPDTPADDRFDQVLFALHQLQGQLADLRMTLDEIRDPREGQREGRSPTGPPAGKSRPAGRSPKPTGAKSIPARAKKTAAAAPPSKTRTRKTRMRQVRG
jgi:hypothetical protein